MVTVYEQGDIVYLNFSPQAGHEQKGFRPALVVSNATANRFTRLVMVCPITHADRNQPFHVKLDDRTKTGGFVMADQVRMADLMQRQARYIEKAPADIVSEVVDIITGFMESPGTVLF